MRVIALTSTHVALFESSLQSYLLTQKVSTNTLTHCKRAATYTCKDPDPHNAAEMKMINIFATLEMRAPVNHSRFDLIHF